MVIKRVAGFGICGFFITMYVTLLLPLLPSPPPSLFLPLPPFLLPSLCVRTHVVMILPYVTDCYALSHHHNLELVLTYSNISRPRLILIYHIGYYLIKPNDTQHCAVVYSLNGREGLDKRVHYFLCCTVTILPHNFKLYPALLHLSILFNPIARPTFHFLDCQYANRDSYTSVLN